MQDVPHDDRPRSFLVYAPARTAVVYALADYEFAPKPKERFNFLYPSEYY